MINCLNWSRNTAPSQRRPRGKSAGPKADANQDDSDDGGEWIKAFIKRHGLNTSEPVPYKGGYKWKLDVCPFNAEHNDGSAVITEAADGKLGFRCHHNGCSGKDWHALRDLLEPNRGQQGGATNPSASSAGDSSEVEQRHFQCYSASELVAAHPTMKPYVVEELLRKQETANLIAAPKVGKSWLAMSLALCVAAGKAWLGTFSTSVGSVLLIDNELHPETLSARIAKLAASLGIDLDEIGDRLTVVPVRGEGLSYQRLDQVLDQFGEKRFDLTILDAGYRFLEHNQDENANGDVLQNYNLLDRFAAKYSTAFVIVHHTSKGSQGDKATTDIGAGAGAQSRAADTHIALIPHETPEAVVMRVDP